MGFNNGTITLNSPNSAYYPGQIISGNITFTLEMPTTFAVITATFTGKGKVKWQEADGDQCAGQEEYFNVTLPLCGGNGLFTLAAGEHQYSFQCQIPFEVPGTFEDDKGSIEYYVEAVADSPSIRNKSVTKKFIVVVPVDLNNIEECKQPIEMEFEKSSGACCFGGGAVAVQFRVPVSGFCPGQTIPIHVSVDNESSNVEIRRLLFELISVTAYRSQSPRSELVTSPVVVERIKRGPLLCKAKGDFTVNFPVPALIAQSLDVCELFGIEYSLRVTIKMTGCSKDESDEATIYMGHVPLNGTGDFVHPLKENLPSGPIPIKPFAPSVLEQKQNVSLPGSGPQVGCSATTATENAWAEDALAEDALAEAKALYESVFSILTPRFSSPIKTDIFDIKNYPLMSKDNHHMVSESNISTSVFSYTFRLGGSNKNEKTTVYSRNKLSTDNGSEDNGSDDPYDNYADDDDNFENDDEANNADYNADDTAGDDNAGDYGGGDSE